MGEDAFAPEEAVTREQLAVILSNYAKLKEHKAEDKGIDLKRCV